MLEREQVLVGSPFREYSAFIVKLRVGGEIFRLKFTDKNEASVTKITPAGGRNSRFSKVWMCVAEQYLIIQDGLSQAIVIEGDAASRSIGVAVSVPVFSMVRGVGDEALIVTVTTTAPHGYKSGDIVSLKGSDQSRYNGKFEIDLVNPYQFTFEITGGAPVRTSTGRSTATGYNQVPTGTVMVFGMGRLWVASPDRKKFVAGDISGGATSILTFSENTFLNEGGSFSLPIEMGRITAMNFSTVNDSATGQGELMVFGEYGIVTVNAGVPRSQWKNQQIERVTLRGIGATGANSVANVNGDVFFRSHDGLRSYRSSRQEQGSWGHTPISREVSRYLDFDTPFWLDNAQCCFFDNRLVFSTSPVQWGRFSYHRGMLVLDFDTLSSISGKQPPSYDGLWTGIRPVTLTVGSWQGEECCFATSHDQDEVNRVYRISKTSFGRAAHSHCFSKESTMKASRAGVNHTACGFTHG